MCSLHPVFILSSPSHFPTLPHTVCACAQQLTDIQSLKGAIGARKYVVGCISRSEDGRYVLEDSSASVPFDMSSAEAEAGFYTGMECVKCVGSVGGVEKTPAVSCLWWGNAVLVAYRPWPVRRWTCTAPHNTPLQQHTRSSLAPPRRPCCRELPGGGDGGDARGRRVPGNHD